MIIIEALQYPPRPCVAGFKAWALTLYMVQKAIASSAKYVSFSVSGK